MDVNIIRLIINTLKANLKRKSHTKIIADMFDVKFAEQVIESLFSIVVWQRSKCFKDRHNIVAYGEPAEHGGFLGQIAEAAICPFVHRSLGDIFIIKEDLAGFTANRPDNHIETGRLAGAVGAKQTNNLTTVDGDGYVPNNRMTAIGFREMFSTELV